MNNMINSILNDIAMTIFIGSRFITGAFNLFDLGQFILFFLAIIFKFFNFLIFDAKKLKFLI